MVVPIQIPKPVGGGEVRFERIDPLEGEAWESLVKMHPSQTVFHRAAWARALVETYGHRPFYLRVLVDGADAALVPLMEVRSPMTGIRGISLPFSDFAGPLWNSPCRKVAVDKFLLEVAAEQHWHHLELRGGSPMEAEENLVPTYWSHQLDLRPGLAQVEVGLAKGTKRSIHKAEHSGLDIRISNDPKDMGIFYQLHVLTRRRHGLPPQPSAFFHAVGRHLIESGLGFVVLAFHARTAVAAAVFLTSERRALFKYGASDKAHWPRRPNHRVMWSAIKHLIAGGCHFLDFGRTSTDDFGLIRFKESWGATAAPLNYHRYNLERREPASRSGSLPQGIPFLFGHLPLALNRFAGRLIYPHLD